MLLRTSLARSSATLRAATSVRPQQPVFALSTSAIRRAADSKPSPAERPPRASPAATTESSGPAFEPVVNDQSSTDGPRTVSSSSPVESSSTTPNAPGAEGGGAASAAQIPSEPYAIPDRPDFSKLPSLDIDPTLPPSIAEPESERQGGSGGRTGAKSKHSMSSIERRRRALARLMIASTLVGGAATVVYLGSQETPATQKVDTSDANAAVATWKRFKANFSDLTDYFNKPAFDKLLPDPLPPPHQRPYTLCIDLEHLLVSSTWDRKNGWKTAKRPGVDYFLAYLSQFYEIVLFTSQPLYTALPVAEKLDPFGAYLPYKLFRESTRYVKGKVVKDLSFLNRDLSKVILLDVNPEHGALQPENTIIIPPWKGTPGDKGLVEMIPFLESIGIFAPPDVRPIIKAYEGKNIPIEYAKREAERKQAAIEEWQREHGNTMSTGGSGTSWLSSAFGSIGGNAAASRPTQPMTYLEQKRAQAQQLYKEEQEYWAKNADEIRRLMEEDRQKQIAEGKGSLMSFIGGPKPPQPEAK